MILLRVSLLFLALFLLPDWYICKTYLSDGPYRKWKKKFWWPTLVLIAVLIVFLIGHNSLHDYFGTYLIVALCVTIPKTIFMLVSILLRLFQKLFRCHLPHGSISLVPAVLILGYILFGAIKGKEYFQVKEVTFCSPDLPEAFDGYRILQLSDIHSGSWKGNGKALQKAIDLCNQQKADLAVFTGDLVNSRADELLEFMPIFSQLKAPDGVYSVLGNHDYGTYVRWENEQARLANVDSLIAREGRMGWHMLLNDSHIIYKGKDSLALAGVENSGKPPFPDRGDLPKALKGTDGMFTVLLSHDPTHWRRKVLPDTSVQLTLSGHTHDMQISLFGFSVSRFIYPEHRGLYLEGPRGLYVNIGLGYVLFPMRLGAWPEITVITLKKHIQLTLKITLSNYEILIHHLPNLYRTTHFYRINHSDGTHHHVGMLARERPFLGILSWQDMVAAYLFPVFNPRQGRRPSAYRPQDLVRVSGQPPGSFRYFPDLRILGTELQVDDEEKLAQHSFRGKGL